MISNKPTKRAPRIFRAYRPYPKVDGTYVASIWDVTNQEPMWSPHHSEEQRIAEFRDDNIDVVQCLLDAAILSLTGLGWSRRV